MKLMNTFSVGVAIVGMTCLVGHASAASTAADDLISDSMLVAQSTPSPGGRGGGTAGETGRGDKGTQSGSKKQGTPGDTIPEKARPGTEKDTGTGGNTGSDSGRTGTSSESPGSSTGTTSGSGSPGMSGSGSGSSSGAGGGGK